MSKQENVRDDGTCAFAVRYAASLLINAGLNKPNDSRIEDAGRAFFAAPREKLGEMALVLYTITKRYYAENPPDAEQIAEWESMK